MRFARTMDQDQVYRQQNLTRHSTQHSFIVLFQFISGNGSSGGSADNGEDGEGNDDYYVAGTEMIVLTCQLHVTMITPWTHHHGHTPGHHHGSHDHTYHRQHCANL